MQVEGICLVAEIFSLSSGPNRLHFGVLYLKISDLSINYLSDKISYFYD